MKSRRWVMLPILLLLVVACEGFPPGATAESKSKSEAKSQGPSRSITDSGEGEVPSSRDVEIRAGSYPKAPPPREAPSIFTRDVPGTSGRTCVNVNRNLDAMGRDGALRSGEFVAGPFGSYTIHWTPYNEGKLWWAPLHTDRMPGVRVEAILLDEPSVRRSYEFSTVGFTEDAFYPSGTLLPKSGTWRLFVTSGPDWGCFELTLPG
jgi:hypothetical protein